MSALAAALLAAGAVLLLLAAWGIVRLPDALARQHAATKGGTLALACICLGAVAAVPQAAWVWRLALIVGLLLVTLPVASHLLARAAVREAGRDEEAAASPLVGGEPR